MSTTEASTNGARQQPVQAALRALDEALQEADNTTSAGKALHRVAGRFRFEYEGQRDAFKWGAEKALLPFFDGDTEATKTVVWPIVDAAGATNDAPVRNLTPGSDSVTGLEDGDWPAPVPLGPGAPDPLPLDALPAWLRDQVASVADACQVPSDLPLTLALASVSTAVANRARVRIRPGWDEPVNVYTAVVLPPGSRKSPVFRHMTAGIHEYEAEKATKAEPDRLAALDKREVLEKALAKAKKDAAKAVSAESEGDALQAVKECRKRLDDHEVPPVPRLVVSDITTERVSQLMAENEGRIAVLAPEGDLFRVMGGRYSSGTPNFDVYKRAWTGDEPIRDDRVGREGTHVPRPALTFGLTVQPALLERLEHRETFRGEGLLARFLWAAPEPRVGSRATGADVPELDHRVAQRYDTVLRQLLKARPEVDADGEPVPHTVPLSPGAREALYGFEAEVESRLRPTGTLARIPDWGAKLHGQAVRLGALLHAARQVGDGFEPWADPISRSAMEGGVALARAFIPHALRVFDAMEADPVTRTARYVLRRLREAVDEDEETSERDLYQRCRGKTDIGSIDDLRGALRTLETHGWVRREERPREGPGRPPSPLVRLNPKPDESIPKIPKTPPESVENRNCGDIGDVSVADENKTGESP